MAAAENSEKRIGDDLIWGARGIADELRVSQSRAFYLLETGAIPAQKINGLWVASRRRLAVHFASEEE